MVHGFRMQHRVSRCAFPAAVDYTSGSREQYHRDTQHSSRWEHDGMESYHLDVITSFRLYVACRHGVSILCGLAVDRIPEKALFQQLSKLDDRIRVDDKGRGAEYVLTGYVVDSFDDNSQVTWCSIRK
jgi:hypothetical protein